MDITNQLDTLKAQDKFPEADWEKRGLNPSDEKIRAKMNREVNEFIDFVKLRLESGEDDLTEDVQAYFDDWDSFDFETEETEYMADVMCKVMRLAGVNCQDILI